MENGKDRLIVVLGMHRSGTSALTRSLQVVGVDLGENLMPPADGNNAKGFWEDMDLYALNVEMLAALQSDWHHLKPITTESVETLRQKGFLERGIELVRAKLRPGRPFGLKDPRVAILLPFWKRVFARCDVTVDYILALRSPMSVAQSLSKRDKLDMTKSYLLWFGHVLSSLRLSRDEKLLIVDYDNLLQQPDREICRISSFLNLPVESNELEQYKIEFLDTNLRHSVHRSDDMRNDSNCPPIVVDIYEVLLEVALDNQSTADSQFLKLIDQWTTEFERLEATLRLVDRISCESDRQIGENEKTIDILRLELHAQNSTLAAVNIDKDREIEVLRTTVDALHASRSWRWTAPGRQASTLIKGVAADLAKLGLPLPGRQPQPTAQEPPQQEEDVQLQSSLEQLHGSDLFDADYYLATNGDLAGSGLDPAIHFVLYGWREHRNPSAAFDTAAYLSDYPDVARAGVNPLLHYLQYGREEGRRIRPVRLLPQEATSGTDGNLHAASAPPDRGLPIRIGHTLSRLSTVISAIRPAISFYQDSPLLALRRASGVFRREGMTGIIRRAFMLTGMPLVGEEFSSADLYGDVRPLAVDFHPLVSVIVPNYNHAPYLAERLDSIYRQSYSNVEIILLDDCSSDDSRDVLRDYAARDPERTICRFNEVNSGGVFKQWKKGLELAKGDLIWIAESDDYCSDNFLEEMVRCFQTEGVKLAFSDTEFVRGTEPETIWRLKDYLHELALQMWGRPFIRSAHALVKAGWVAKNLVPNVSSAVFRHPGKMDLFDDPEWLQMRLCGDWVFYLTLVRGGLVAYNPTAVNYYRQHVANTSVNAQKEDIYYREHEIVAKRIVSLYRVDPQGLERQEQVLYGHWCTHRGDGRLPEFRQLYDLQRILPFADTRLPNVLMAVYALAAGGGETFPVMLANELARKGYAGTVLNCRQQATQPGVRAMVSPQVSLLELEHMERLPTICADMGIEVVHSHHAWVDMTLAMLLMGRADIRQVISTHGMYEMMTPEQVASFRPLLRNRIDAFVYTAQKNLAAFPPDLVSAGKFHRIDNALPSKPIQQMSRQALGLGDDDFVLCLVARAIPEKGWEEAITAITAANARSPRRVNLLLIGEGPEFDRLRPRPAGDPVHFLGFKSNIRDYFAAADMGFLPSRFKGESAPLVLIDCLLAGKPVLASDIGEIRFMLDTPMGLAGVLFPLQDWTIDTDGLADLIVAIANDPERYASMVSRVPEAAAKFEMAAMVEKYEDVYRSVLTLSGRPT